MRHFHRKRLPPRGHGFLARRPTRGAAWRHLRPLVSASFHPNFGVNGMQDRGLLQRLWCAMDLIPQISRAYSATVRSLVNFPLRATLRIAFCAHTEGSWKSVIK